MKVSSTFTTFINSNLLIFIVTQPVIPATALLPYKEDMMQLFGTAYTSTTEYDQLRRTGLQGIQKLLFLSGLLLPNEVSKLILCNR
jgi:hypothetical protein